MRHIPKSITPPGLRSGLPAVLSTGDDDDDGENGPPVIVGCAGSGVGEERSVEDSPPTSIMVMVALDTPTTDEEGT